MVFFTADQHFGHENIIGRCGRPFSSVEEMDSAMLENWNSRVSKQDTVYVLGDLFFKNAFPAKEYLLKLNGKKHLIFGNHDKGWMAGVNPADFFLSVTQLSEISDGDRKLYLCHYPLMAWNGTAKGSYMVHGHMHNKTDIECFTLIRSMPNLLNAGVEVNEYQPVTFDELVENNKLFKENHH
ncbi:MAG: metallophosphoesterase family protein [Oscillospiraceae bacterium]|nr:metallophosphoesterase family protein [Oscillospiraceae bacterium]